VFSSGVSEWVSRFARHSICYRRRQRLIVAELLPEVVEWNRGALGPLAGHPLNDNRVRVE
jgi:hypothetical protein